ncbi:MAG: hypothetical protein ACYCO5_00535 [Acidobacteriaceae bacterium]
MDTLDIVRSFGPMPLDELTARVSSQPAEVAEEINRLTKGDLLQVSDQEGRPVDNITPEQATSAPFLVKLTSKAIKRSLAR